MDVQRPRGFGERDLTPIRSTQKELWEEIGAVLHNPSSGEEIHYHEAPEETEDPNSACTELGSITIDSGRQCGVVYIIKAELLSYKINKDHEGILDVIEVSKEEIQQMILDGIINDSFTIEAFSMWMMREQSENR